MLTIDKKDRLTTGQVKREEGGGRLLPTHSNQQIHSFDSENTL